MKIFKAAIIIILALAAAVPAPAHAAADINPSPLAADGRVYARADTRNAYFCTAKDIEKALFAVPYTYCVEVLAEDGDWYCVRYAKDEGDYRALTGFCLKEGLTITDDPPENLYLNRAVTVSFKTSVSDDPGLPTLGEITVTAAYYGVYYRGAAAYSYVCYDGEFGYVQGANDDYPLNEIPAIEEEAPQDAGEQNGNLITALIITAIAAAAIAVLFFTGRRKRAKDG